MSGGARDCVAGYITSSSDASGFTSAELNIYSKYLDLYPDNTIITSWHHGILGDATGEMGPFYYYADKDNNKRYHNNWYNDNSCFLDSANPWLYRGGLYVDGVLASQFYFNGYTGDTNTGVGSRLVLTIK